MPVPPIASPRARTGLLVAVILLAAAAVHARGLAGEPTEDDRFLIERNPGITELAGLPRLFTSGYWDFQAAPSTGDVGAWRPLASVVLALAWKIAGTGTWAYHAAALALHLGATVAAFLLARRVSGSAWIAAGTALLFALHPAQVESVAWVAAMSAPLAGLFVLLGCERFLAWRARGSRGLPLASAASFLLALLAQEAALAFVPLVVALDCLRPDAARPRWTERARAALRTAPLRTYGALAGVFAAYVVARVIVFASPLAGFARAEDLGPSGLGLAQLRIELFGGALEILALPIDLALFRPVRERYDAFDPALVRAAVFCAVYLALLAASLIGRRPRALAALLFVGAGLLPMVVRAPALGAFPLAERHLYTAVFGFALGVALLLEHALPKRAATAILLVLAGLYAARSWTRVGVWRDEEALYRDAAARAGGSVAVQYGLGRVLLQRLDRTGDPRYLAEAGQAFERAAEILGKAKERGLVGSSFDYLQVNLGLAWCEIAARDYSAAILMLQDLARRIEEIQAREREARAQGIPVRAQSLDLARVYIALGLAQSASGHPEEAERSFARALEIEPDSADAHARLGHLRVAQGRWPEAAREFETASRLRPGSTEDRLQLANALQMQGEHQRADALALQLVEELPERSDPLVMLAVGALKRGNTAEGLTWLQRALALEPRNSNAWYQKACALLQRGDRSGALSAFRNATEIDPTNFVAHHDYAGFLLGEGLNAEAQPYLVRAYVVSPPQHRAALRDILVRMELDDGPTLLELARADAQRDEPAAALVWLDRLLAREPDHLEAILTRARVLRRLGRDEDALAGFRAASERAPESYEIWSELGGYLHALGRFEEARPVLERALELERPRELPQEVWEASRERLREMLKEGQKE